MSDDHEINQVYLGLYNYYCTLLEKLCIQYSSICNEKNKLIKIAEYSLSNSCTRSQYCSLKKDFILINKNHKNNFYNMFLFLIHGWNGKCQIFNLLR